MHLEAPNVTERCLAVSLYVSAKAHVPDVSMLFSFHPITVFCKSAVSIRYPDVVRQDFSFQQCFYRPQV